MPSPAGPDKYQLAGIDERERGFNRPVDLEPERQGYRAILRYEHLVLTTESHPTQDLALQALIRTLQDQGYRQLRTQLSFRNGVYLGSQELWIEYPDQPPAAVTDGWLARIAGWFQRRAG